MAAQIITKEDLDEFGAKLLIEIKILLGKSPDEPKKWLKSYQVKNLLKISSGTLQNLRTNGTLKFTKIGGIIYYKMEDINKILEGGLKCGYFGETDHPIPWQIDHLNCWRTDAANAVEAFTKIVI